MPNNLTAWESTFVPKGQLTGDSDRTETYFVRL